MINKSIFELIYLNVSITSLVNFLSIHEHINISTKYQPIINQIPTNILTSHSFNQSIIHWINSFNNQSIRKIHQPWVQNKKILLCVFCKIEYATPIFSSKLGICINVILKNHICLFSTFFPLCLRIFHIFSCKILTFTSSRQMFIVHK